MEKRTLTGVSVIGSVNMDIVLETSAPAAGETVLAKAVHYHPGGKGANQAVAAARAGGDVRFAGALGKDSFAVTLRRSLTASGVDTAELLEIPDVPCGVAIVQLSGSENRIIVASGANAAYDTEHVDALDIDFFRERALLLQLETSLAVVARAMARARALGSFVMLDPAPAQEAARDLCPLADLVTPNQQEAEQLTGVKVDDWRSAERAARAFLDLGARAAIVKMGEAGALLHTGTDVLQLQPLKVDAVDTVGAGDCFSGALAARIVAGASLPEAAHFAMVAAALQVTRPGAQAAMPRRAEIEARLKESV